MPETPDFDQIADQLCEAQGLDRLDEWDPANHALIREAVVEQLRLVWNARGLADLDALDREARRVYAEALSTGREDLTIELVTAVKALDR